LGSSAIELLAENGSIHRSRPNGLRHSQPVAEGCSADQQGGRCGDRPGAILDARARQRLWDIGAIRGIHAEIDERALGVGIEALLMIELSKHERAVVDSFMQEVGRIAEVRSAFLLSGRWDVIVHVVARDTAHLKDLALDKFTNRAGVTRIETAIVYDARRRHEVPMIRAEQE
jgi:DNA-binding Lrp family transcriptional regulator